MDRWESAAWSLAGGGLCTFVAAVVFKDADWRVGCALAAISVAVWAFRAPVAAGATLGLIGWLLVTGFDVVKIGDLTFAGVADLVRFGVLVGAGAASSLCGWWLVPGAD